MNDVLYDSRFSFRHDNPFERDSDRSYLKRLQQYFAQNQEKFTEIDYLEDSRYLILCSDVTKLFGYEVQNRNISSNPISKEIKDFIRGTPGISKDLSAWCEEVVEAMKPAITIGTSIPRVGNKDDDDYSTGEFNMQQYNADIIPNMPSKFSQSLSAGLHYDISNDKSLSYEDVCKLCMNIARMKLVNSNIERDETVEALEREKRKKLTQQIMWYKGNKLIDPLVDADLSEMTLEQLETCLEQCIRYQENFKTLELFKRGFGAGGIVYDTVFPEGIPISKTKRLCFKGVGKEILSTLFNTTTTTGIAFQNILQKNNIHVSDELLTLVAFGEICLSKVEIKTVGGVDETKKDAINDETKKEEEEEYEDEEEELMEVEE